MILKLSHPEADHHVTVSVFGHPADAPFVTFDLTDSKHGYVSEHDGRAHVFSNIKPADARRVALALLRQAAHAEGRPTQRPDFPHVERLDNDPVRAELYRALDEESGR